MAPTVLDSSTQVRYEYSYALQNDLASGIHHHGMHRTSWYTHTFFRLGVDHQRTRLDVVHDGSSTRRHFLAQIKGVSKQRRLQPVIGWL